MQLATAALCGSEWKMPERSALRIVDCADNDAILLVLTWSDEEQLVDTTTS